MSKIDFRNNPIIKLDKSKPANYTVAVTDAKTALSMIAEYSGIDIEKFNEKYSKLTSGQRNVLLTDMILSKTSRRYRKEIKQYHKELNAVQSGLECAMVPNAKNIAKECVMNEVKDK